MSVAIGLGLFFVGGGVAMAAWTALKKKRKHGR